MPIFTRQLQQVDLSDPAQALKKMVNHIKYIQEQLEYTLTNLDSQNVREIDTDVTTVTDSSGSTSIGAFISLSGNSGERFTAGKGESGTFEFSVRGKNGVQALYLDSAGGLILTKHTTVSIDCGEW